MPDSAAFFNGIQTIIAEMKTIGPILATSTVRHPIASPSAGITATSVVSGDKTYIIAVNSSNQAISGVQFPASPTMQFATVLFENRSVQSSGKAIMDNFSPYASHVYMFGNSGVRNVKPKRSDLSTAESMMSGSGSSCNIAGRRMKHGAHSTLLLTDRALHINVK